MFTGVVNLDSVLEDQNRNRDGRVVGILPSRMDAQSLGKKSSDRCMHWRLLHVDEGWTPISTSSMYMERGFS
jgi:hypothetical protein